MAKYLFRSRWIALIWALSICFTISRFFGDGGGQEQLAAAAQDIRAQRMAQSRQIAQEHEQTQPDGEYADEFQDASADMEADEPY